MTIFLMVVTIIEFSAICVLIYNRVPKTTGVMHLVETDEKKSFILELDSDFDDVKDGDIVLFRIQEDRG